MNQRKLTIFAPQYEDLINLFDLACTSLELSATRHETSVTAKGLRRSMTLRLERNSPTLTIDYLRTGIVVRSAIHSGFDLVLRKLGEAASSESAPEPDYQ